jgi:hypothetical protein
MAQGIALQKKLLMRLLYLIESSVRFFPFVKQVPSPTQIFTLIQVHDLVP